MKHLSDYISYDELIKESYFEEVTSPKNSQRLLSDSGLIYISTEIIDDIKSQYKEMFDNVILNARNKYKSDVDIDPGTLITNYKKKSNYYKYNIVDSTVLSILEGITLKSLNTLHSDKINLKVLSELTSDSHLDDNEDMILVTRNPSNYSHTPLIRVVAGKYKGHFHSGYQMSTVGGDVYLFSYDNENDRTMLVIKRETYEDFDGKLSDKYWEG